VQHPNIASATDFGQLDDGSYFLVLEYVPGVTLNKIIARGPVPVRRAVAIARQIASALQAAHGTGIVHRDVKPANVMVVESQNDAVKLIDFGLAQVRMDEVPTIAPRAGEKDQVEQALTAVGVVFGTVAYMAPEAALGMAAVDARSDLYALGITMYEMLCGRHPFDASEPVQLFLQQRTVVPPPVSSRVPGAEIPKALEDIVARLLAKDPADRIQSAREVLGALDAAMLSAAFDAVSSAPLAAPLAPPHADASDDAKTIARPWGAAVEAAAAEMRAEPEPPLDPSRSLPHFPLPTLLRGTPPEPPAASPAAGAGSDRPKWRVILEQARLRERLAGLVRGERQPAWVYGALGGVFVILVLLVVAIFSGSSAPAGVRAEGPPPPQESASGSAPVAPASAAAEAPGTADGRDVAALRTSLIALARAKDWDKAVQAVLDIARFDASAIRDREVATAFRTVAVAVEQDGGERSDKLFDGLGRDTGVGGLDLLYDLGRTRSGTKAGKRASTILKQPDVEARATPALKVLMDLSRASCDKKRGMFDRVGEEGDARALAELTSLRDAECNRWRDPCCFKDSRALANAIRALRAKIGHDNPPR
jgi:serine/threonine-protein kinase